MAGIKGWLQVPVALNDGSCAVLAVIRIDGQAFLAGNNGFTRTGPIHRIW